MNTFYIVRHGKTFWNLEKRTQGRLDSELLPESIEEAKLLRQRLNCFDIDKVYSSDLKRAQETAKLLMPEKRIHLSEGFREIGFGVWEGLTFDQIIEDHGELLEQWKREPGEVVFPRGESVADTQQRVSRAFREIDEQEEGKNILIVSHGITIKLLMASLLQMPVSGIFRITQDNLALNIVRTTDERTEIITMNDTAHLEKDRRRTDDNRC